MLVGCSTAASLFPFVGTIVYMILRPPEYLEDVRERELEMQAAEARLHELDSGLCPYCDYRVERDFIRCPSCLRKLKERCVSCSRPLEQDWTICPYCETEVPGRAARVATAAAAACPRPKASMRRAARAGAPGSPAGGLETAVDPQLTQATPEVPRKSRSDADEEISRPLVAPETSAGVRGAGRAGRPGGRPRPAP